MMRYVAQERKGADIKLEFIITFGITVGLGFLFVISGPQSRKTSPLFGVEAQYFG